MVLKACCYILLILNIMIPLDAQNIETITGRGEVIYPYSGTKTYLIKRESSSAKYFDISVFNIPIELKKGETTIYREETKSEEFSYFFEHDGSDYYLNFTKGAGYAGFNIRSSDKEFSSIFTSSFEFIVYSKRSYEITLQNDKTSPQLICLVINCETKLQVESSTFKENDDSFIPIKDQTHYSSNDTYIYYYYLILNDNKITANLNFETIWYSSKTKSTKGTMTKDSSKIKSISDNYATCLSKGNGLYTISSNSYSHYELYFTENSKIYYMKSNQERIELESKKIYDKNTNFIYVDATNSESCFSITFLNEKFIMKDNSTFYLNLFDSRNYDIIINNSKAKYFQIKFEKNYYFNLTKIEFPNQDKEIKALYFSPSDYYVYQFKRESDEMPIKIYFDKLSTISTGYKTVNFDFYAFDEDMKIIEEDYFECISQEKSFILKANSGNKPYLNFKTNKTGYVKLNETNADYEEQIIMEDDKFYFLNVFGNEKEPICIYAYYAEKEIIEVKKNKKNKFKIFYTKDYLHYEFNLLDLKVGSEIVLRFESNNKKTIFSSMNLEGANKDYISTISNPDNIKITPKKKTVKIILKVITYESPDNGTFYFYSEKTTDYKALLTTAKIFTYISFGILALPFLIAIFCSSSVKYEDEKKLYFYEKISSVYLCKKYEKIK